MKNYLFGLGAMLVGAGLMLVLTYGEVSADSKWTSNSPRLEESSNFLCESKMLLDWDSKKERIK